MKPKTLLDKEGTEAVAAEEIEEPEEDLEESVAKEIEAIRALNRPKGPEDDFVFAPVRVDVACLLFVKTRPPIEPVEFVRRICLDALGRGDAPGASGCSLDRKTRHVNRLTPVSWVGRATMDDLLEGARGVLGKQFVLRGTSAAQDAVVEGGKGGKDGNGEETTKEPSPAPRPCSVGHSKRDPMRTGFACLILTANLYSMRSGRPSATTTASVEPKSSSGWPA